MREWGNDREAARTITRRSHRIWRSIRAGVEDHQRCDNVPRRIRFTIPIPSLRRGKDQSYPCPPPSNLAPVPSPRAVFSLSFPALRRRPRPRPRRPRPPIPELRPRTLPPAGGPRPPGSPLPPTLPALPVEPPAPRGLPVDVEPRRAPPSPWSSASADADAARYGLFAPGSVA